MLKIVLISLFIISYSFIALEQIIKINKSAVAIFSGVLSWIFVMTFSSDPINLNTQLGFHISEIASVLFFLMGAMTIVELIDAHNGFDVITQKLIDVRPMYLILIMISTNGNIFITTTNINRFFIFCNSFRIDSLINFFLFRAFNTV